MAQKKSCYNFSPSVLGFSQSFALDDELKNTKWMVIALLSVTGCTSAPPPQPPPPAQQRPTMPLDLPAAAPTEVYRVEVREMAGKYVLFRQAPGGMILVRLMESPKPITQEAVSSNGQFASYVSFESGSPALFIQNNHTGRRQSCRLIDSDITTTFTEDSTGLVVEYKEQAHLIPIDASPFAQIRFAGDSPPFCTDTDQS